MSDSKMVDVILGPYRNQRLTMSAADAQSAVNNHWATDPEAAPDDHPHPPLTDEERQAAHDAANDWAQATWDAAQGIEPPDPPPEGGVTRDMSADEPGKHTTRAAKPRHR
jgi:hypothetical protein